MARADCEGRQTGSDRTAVFRPRVDLGTDQNSRRTDFLGSLAVGPRAGRALEVLNPRSVLAIWSSVKAFPGSHHNDSCR
jgi:hypothetical protein